MLRSLLLLLCVLGTLGLAAQDADTQANITLKAQYEARGHHSRQGLFHGAGLQLGIQLDESWSLLLHHSRYTYNQADGRLRSGAVGVRYLINDPTEAVQFFAESSLAILSSQASPRSNFKTGWELEGGFAVKKPLAQWLFLEAKALHSFGVIYGERAYRGDIAPDSTNSRVKVFSIRFGLGVQF